MNKHTLQEFIKQLKTYRHLLPKQTVKTIRGQAIKGNIEAAEKGLKTALDKANVMNMAHRQTKVIIKHHKVDYRDQLQCSLKESHRVKSSTL